MRYFFYCLVVGYSMVVHLMVMCLNLTENKRFYMKNILYCSSIFVSRSIAVTYAKCKLHVIP